MKKQLLTIIAVFATCHSFAQNTFPQNGNVGIGILNPQTLLDVQGAVRFGQDTTFRRIIFDQDRYGGETGFSLESEQEGILAVFSRYTTDENDGHAIVWGLYGYGGGTAQNPSIAVLNGNVGIGINKPDAKLAVNGIIHSQAVKVDMMGWSDYVLKSSYSLTKLADVKNYIDQNHHLPDVPSESQIQKDGIDVGEMNKLLLKKIEELTLYLIEKDQKDEALQKQFDQLTKKVQALTAKSGHTSL